jgi:hypothetical protein
VVPFYYPRLSHRTLRPISIGVKGVAFYYAILVWNAYDVACMQGGVVPACSPP